MQNINTIYTVYINKKYQRFGHLFQGRFKGIIVDKDEYLVTLSRYIHLNPVRAKIAQRPEDYRWTSYRAYVDKAAKGSFVDTLDTLSCFSKTKGNATNQYRAFVEAGIGVEGTPLKDIEAGVILGGRKFKAGIRKLLEKIKADEELPQIKRIRENVPIGNIIKTCCSFYGKREEDLIKRGKGKYERQIVIYLSKILGGEKNKEIGSYFGIKGPAVSGAIKTIEGRLDKEKRLKKEMEILRERLMGKIDK
jgi:hypothetical protein